MEKINAKVRHRRHWFLGGAFAVAMMLGAASALLASYLKIRSVPAEVTQVELPDTPVAAVEGIAEAAELAPEESGPKKAPVKKRAVVIAAAKRDDDISEPSDSSPPDANAAATPPIRANGNVSITSSVRRNDWKST